MAESKIPDKIDEAVLTYAPDPLDISRSAETDADFNKDSLVGGNPSHYGSGEHVGRESGRGDPHEAGRCVTMDGAPGLGGQVGGGPTCESQSLGPLVRSPGQEPPHDPGKCKTQVTSVEYRPVYAEVKMLGEPDGGEETHD